MDIWNPPHTAGPAPLKVRPNARIAAAAGDNVLMIDNQWAQDDWELKRERERGGSNPIGSLREGQDCVSSSCKWHDSGVCSSQGVECDEVDGWRGLQKILQYFQ